MRETTIAIVMALLLLLCVAGAATTVRLWLSVGLGRRPPLTPFATAVRFAAVAVALVLWPLRRDWLERSLIVCAVLGGGASGLTGLGLSGPVVAFVRLLFHLLGFSIGAAVIARWFRRNVAGVRRPPIAGSGR